MPQYRGVLTLQSLSLRAIEELIASLATIIIRKIHVYSDSQKRVAYLKRSLRLLEMHLMSHVPHYLYDTMAIHVLQTVKDLIQRTKRTYDLVAPTAAFFTEMNVIVGLTETILTMNLKELDFCMWPKIMRYVLYKNLFKLSGLQVLNLGASAGGWHAGDNASGLINAIRVMKSLQSLCLCFDCNNSIIQALGENCQNLQILDITSSRSVTDRCVMFLLKCKQLIKIQLYRTSISIAGFAILIAGLPKLKDIGRCDEFESIITYMYNNLVIFSTLGLKRCQSRYLCPESLNQLVTMCPKIEHIGLFHDGQVTDMNVLAKFENLKELKLSSCSFYTNSVKQLLETRGPNLYSLHLEHVDEIDVHAIILISQYCPNLRSFVLYNCDIVDQIQPHHAINVKPYQYLERLFWVVDSSIVPLEFILSHSVNIRYIHLGSSSGITHSTIINILASNHMENLEELRILYSSDMSVQTVLLLLEKCKKLKVLSELESWQGISFDELKTLRKYIHSKNFDLDVSPTLSY